MEKSSRKTFKYITRKYNISRPALYKRIRKIPNFQKKYMSKLGNMWLIDPKGVKLITHKKHNSTSPFRVKKIQHNSHYKEKQLTKNDYIKMCKTLIQTNKELSHTNKNQQTTINNLSKQLRHAQLKQPTTPPKLSTKQNHGLINIFKRIF